MDRAIGDYIERRHRPRSPSPTAGPRRLIMAGLVVAVLLGITVLVATYAAVQTVNYVSAADEIARTRVAVEIIQSEGVEAGPAMTARLSHDFLLRDPRITTAGSVGAMEASLPVGNGQVLAWTPHRLGDEMAARLAPLRVTFSVLFIGTMVFVLYRLYRLTVQLEGLRRDARAAADRDPLTAAASRLAFEDRLRSAFADGPPERLALLYLDLDEFKLVNDNFGHAAGDALLRQVADRLVASAQPGDLVARLGGDEFAILRFGVDSRTQLAAEIAQLSQRLFEPYELGATRKTIRVSIGAALAPDDARTAESLVRSADRALYRVKADPAQRFAFAGEPPVTTLLRGHAA